MGRPLTSDEIKEVIALKDEEITKELFIRWFGKTVDAPLPKFNPNDFFTLTAGMLPQYKESGQITTTVGRVLFNIFLNYSIFQGYFPYFNNWDSSKFHKQVAYALIEGTITKKQHSLYQTKKSWLEFTPTELLVPGMSFNMMRPHPEVTKRKKELFKQYEKELAKGGSDAVNAAAAIETELLALAAKLNKNDPAARLFKLKKPSYNGNYKNMSVMIGAQRDNTDPTKFHISESNFTDGIDKEEFASHADQLIYGTYQRSVNTQEGGAQTKELSAAFEAEQIDLDPNSDCGTKLYTTVAINEGNVELYFFHWVLGTKGLLQILPSNKKQFVDKTWKMRSALYCNAEIYCSRCAGSLYQRLGIKDAGLTISSLGSTITNLSMKSFHNSNIQVGEIQWEHYFSD